MARSGNGKANSAHAVAAEGAQAIKHEDKRVNIPTADAIDLVTEQVEELKKVEYSRVPWIEDRDRALDPQLVWKGKDEADRTDLSVIAPPIFRQERIEPQYLVNQLLKESKERRIKAADDAEDGALFGISDVYFADGIPDELDKIDWYNHQMNWTNRMILGDSLQVMASLAEREDLRGKVQMIYIDPPYGISFGSNWQATVDNSRVRDGKLEDATREVEQIKAFRDTWAGGIGSYLTYLRDRLAVARDLLTESGSVFVQIGDENVHLVRSLLDEVFGAKNFVALISFATTSGFPSKTIGRAGDYLLWFAKSIDCVKSRTLWVEQLKEPASGYRWLMFPDGTYRGMTSREIEGVDPVPSGARIYMPDNIQSQGSASKPQPFEYGGKTYSPRRNAHWKASYPDGMNRLALAGRIHVASDSVRYVRFADDSAYRTVNTVWTDTGTGNFTADKLYVVQTNIKVIERCMLLATDPGDLVLDPTCGSGTTAYVAEQWGRRWITIDTSRVALALARHRIMGAKFPAYYLADSAEGKEREAQLTGQLADKSVTHNDVRRGFVYERARHLMLDHIAKCPEIKDGMSKGEIDAVVEQLAEKNGEVLLDKPYENKRALRVAGPFTVESLSPHRSVAFESHVSAAERAAEQMAVGGSYTETILEHVKKAGVQNGVRKERLEFESVELVSGRTLTAVGVRKRADEGTPTRVGIALGPEYGTVDPLFIKNAGREALAAGNIDLLLILGFAFDPTAVEAVGEFKPESQSFAEVVRERTVGKMPVLLVRMNADLAMGDELLKNTGAGNLFTVFGEPDIEVTETDDGRLVVEILGLDTYDPTKGEVKSMSTDGIMLWSIDTDYDSEAFFVRHVYFSGTADGKPKGPDPYDRLRKTLKAEVDADAWSSLYRTRSRPFPKPESGKIAVKVVNVYGDEVLKVIEV